MKKLELLEELYESTPNTTSVKDTRLLNELYGTLKETLWAIDDITDELDSDKIRYEVVKIYEMIDDLQSDISEMIDKYEKI